MKITAKRHSIIIEPNVPVILGKVEKHTKALAVWDKCTETHIKNYLNDDNIKYKKLITTPEGYKKIRNVIYDGCEYIFDDFFMLYDECEKITQDYDYRPNISIPINDFFNKFKNKAFVSATPLLPTDPRFEEQNFRILKIEPQYDYKKDIELTVTNNLESEILKYFEKYQNSNCICAFLNKTDSINSIINTLGIADESKVFCSDESAKKLRREGFNSQQNLQLPLAKYNFFTSRFYSAVDIKLTSGIQPDILIISNNYSYTRIDPRTEAIQIYGRFRNGFNSLTHIALYDEDIEVLENSEIDKRLNAMKQAYDAVSKIKVNYMFDFSEIPNQTIQEQLKKLDYTKYLDENRQLSSFALDNLFYDNEINSYYKSPNALKEAYENTDHFNITYNEVINTNPLHLFSLKSLSTKEKRTEIVNQLERMEQDLANNKVTIQEKNNLIALFQQIDPFIVDIYNVLGKATIEKERYSEAKLTRLLEKHQKKEYRLSKVVAQEVYNNFQARENIYIPKAIVVTELQAIYDKLDIIYKVRMNTIADYYDVSTHNSKNPPSFKLKTRIL